MFELLPVAWICLRWLLYYEPSVFRDLIFSRCLESKSKAFWVPISPGAHRSHHDEIRGHLVSVLFPTGTGPFDYHLVNKHLENLKTNHLVWWLSYLKLSFSISMEVDHLLQQFGVWKWPRQKKKKNMKGSHLFPWISLLACWRKSKRWRVSRDCQRMLKFTSMILATILSRKVEIHDPCNNLITKGSLWLATWVFLYQMKGGAAGLVSDLSGRWPCLWWLAGLSI